MALPLDTVVKTATTELAGQTLLYTAGPRADAAATGGRNKDPWETEFKGLLHLFPQGLTSC